MERTNASELATLHSSLLYGTLVVRLSVPTPTESAAYRVGHISKQDPRKVASIHKFTYANNSQKWYTLLLIYHIFCSVLQAAGTKGVRTMDETRLLYDRKEAARLHSVTSTHMCHLSFTPLGRCCPRPDDKRV